MCVRLFVLAVALLAVGACGEAIQPSGEHTLEAALASAGGKIASVERLVTPFKDASPHRLEIAVTLELKPQDGPRTLLIERIVDRGPAGAFVLKARNTLTSSTAHQGRYSDGRDVIFDGALLASRRAHGPWATREIFEQDEARLLARAYDASTEVVAAFAPYLEFKRDPSADEVIAGVPVSWSVVALRPGASPRPMSKAELDALRDHEDQWQSFFAATHHPKTATGAIARGPTGRILTGTLKVAGTATVDGVRLPFKLEWSAKVSPSPAGVSFEIPSNALSAVRPRLWRVIGKVVGDELLPEWRAR